MAQRVGGIKLGSQGLEVSVQGLGYMDMSAFYDPPKPEEDMIALIHHAVHTAGITFLDTSDVYGPFTNETLLGKALKGGGSLKRLDIDCIDLYYQRRSDTRVPIEVTIGELKKLIEEGKIKYISLSEASASTIKRAHVHPIAVVQLEWSLWSRDVEEERIPTCRELGIGILLPRFQPENLKHNKTISEHVNEMATRKGCTLSQLALAWVHHQGKDVCPIPRTTKIENFKQNIGALSMKLTPEEMAKLESFALEDTIKGERYMNDFVT
ncbi:hypothetical protein CIPAW_02G061100 [Carya illinoinensis]|uniref:NADP-dependent oxidoreductase domain-containing protein n=1 Tax=Carya illinoinensis TaxID=32201 RepID=A0A8T1R981_CARIL|nr:hypothetical protein CIPAW_02G061100 [Carya illinoinensis]